MSQKHLFALYLPDLSAYREPRSLILDDATSYHRITNVLRLTLGEELIVFDRHCHARGTIKEITKKRLVLTIIMYERNKILHPIISIALPVLKKDAFEEALYSCVELGASEIIPYTSAKTHRSLTEHELHRAEKILIAAAEQSKYFSFPSLSPLATLTDIVHRAQGVRIFFDPHGEPASTVMHKVRHTDYITIIVGPEGDLTDEEKHLLTINNFTLCALTPTILRSPVVVVVSLGLLRSLR